MLGAPSCTQWCPKRRVKGQIHIPWPTGHTSFDVAEDVISFLGCECALLSHTELLMHKHPRVFLHRATVDPFSVQPTLVLGIAPAYVQDLSLGLFEHHEVCTGPPLSLQPVKAPLEGIPSFQHASHTMHHGAVGICCHVFPSNELGNSWHLDWETASR